MSLIRVLGSVDTGWMIEVHDVAGSPTSFYLEHVATHVRHADEPSPGGARWYIAGAQFTVRHNGSTHEIPLLSGAAIDLSDITPLVHAHGPLVRRMQEAYSADIEARLAKFPPPPPPPYVPPPIILTGEHGQRAWREDYRSEDVANVYRAGWLDALEYLRADDPGNQCESGCCGSPSAHEEAIDALTDHLAEAKDGEW